MLAKSKLDSIETLVSQALTDMEINHEFNAIIREKKIWEAERECEECGWKSKEYEIIQKKKKKKITSLWIIFEFG